MTTLKLNTECPVCRAVNLRGSLLCAKCGSPLVTLSRPSTRDLRPATSELTADAALPAATGELFTTDMAYRVFFEGETRAPQRVVENEAIVGRADPTTGHAPLIDLGEQRGYLLGVSRRHAMVRRIEDGLFLIDLGSSNGTFVDGRRIPPHQPRRMRHGDRVRFGQFVLRFAFEPRDNV